MRNLNSLFLNETVPSENFVAIESIEFSDDRLYAFLPNAQHFLPLAFFAEAVCERCCVTGAEILALRHQPLILQRSTQGRRLRLKPADRVFWKWLSRLWNGWRSVLKESEWLKVLRRSMGGGYRTQAADVDKLHAVDK
jgi:hypothetical protein